MNKFKVGDKVIVDNFSCAQRGVIVAVDNFDDKFKYKVYINESESVDWFKEIELTLKSPN